MKFITSNVQSIQSQVSSNFKNAKEQMNRIESIYKGITWKSESADQFKATFTKLKTSIVKSFEETESQFSKLMEQTKQDVQSAENANMVN